MRLSRWLTAFIAALVFGPFLASAAEPDKTTNIQIDGKSLADWMKDLGDKDASVRETALRAVVFYPGPHAGDLITLLINRTQDKDVSLRVRAVQALTVLDVKSEEIPRIVKAMIPRLKPGFSGFGADEPQAIVRFHAALCLQRCGEKSHEALATLVNGAVDRESFEVRRQCIRVLEMCGYLQNPPPKDKDKRNPPEPSVTKILLNRCQLNGVSDLETTAQVRLEAAVALGSMGLSADPMLQKKTMETLENLSKHDQDKTVRIWSEVSWMVLDKFHEDGVARIAGFLKSPENSQRIRLHAIQALSMIGTKVKTIGKVLRDLLHDGDPIIVGAAASGLAMMGSSKEAAKEAKEALQSLTELVQDEATTLETKLIAIQALSMAAVHVKEVVPTLIALLGHKKKEVTLSATIALAGLGDKSKEAIPALKLLADRKDTEKGVKETAEFAIKVIEEALKPKPEKKP